MSKKLVILFTGVVLVFVAFAVDITYVNATKGEKYKRQVLSQNQQSYESRTLPFQRGNITDRNGTILATSEKVYNVILDCRYVNTSVEVKTETGTEETQPYIEPTVEALVNLLGVDENTIRGKITDENTKNSQYQILQKNISTEEKKNFEAYVSEYAGKSEKELTEEEKAEKAARANIKGVWFEESYLRTYPLNSLACDLIGFTYSSGTTATWGLEGYYSSVLNGVNGRQFGYYNDEADMEKTIVEAEPGNNVVSTIDVNIQQIIRTAIENFNEKIHVENGADKENVAENRNKSAAKNVAAIVMDPNTGEILGMDSSDWYDLNHATDPEALYSEDEVQKMENAGTLGKVLQERWSNFCIREPFEPGSTAKPMNVAAAYTIGAIDDNTLFDCEGYETISGQMIRCGAYPGNHGIETPGDALKNSCNAALMQIAEKMGGANLLRYQRIFGFGSLTGIDLPGENAGAIFNEETLVPLELATSSFGQGYTVTMIEQIAAFASVVNGGYYYQPHVMKSITDSTGAVLENNDPKLVRQTIPSEISEKMRGFLQTAVREGTGQSAKVPGYTMGGKTGTAEKHPLTDGNYLVSFIGFAPVDHPQVVVYAVVDEPEVENQANSVLAQEIAKEILSETLPYLQIFPDDTDGETDTGDSSEQGASNPDLSDQVAEESDPATSADTLESEGVTNRMSEIIN